MSELFAAEDVRSMKVADLRAALSQRSLSAEGLKQDLVVRLLDSLGKDDKGAKDSCTPGEIESKKIEESASLPEISQTPADAIIPPTEITLAQEEPNVKADTTPGSTIMKDSGATETSKSVILASSPEDIAPSVSGQGVSEGGPASSQHITGGSDIQPQEKETVPIDQPNETSSDLLAQRLREKLLKSGAGFRKRQQREAMPPTSYLRIDNFQRPLQIRVLKQFLEGKIGRSLDDADLWLNSIKTHCYVTLGSEEEAKALRDKVHGVNWPDSNPQMLQANFTQYSAAAAPHSEEAMRRPGEWMHTHTPTAPAAPSPQGQPLLLAEPDKFSSDHNKPSTSTSLKEALEGSGFVTKRRRSDEEAPLHIEYRDIQPVRTKETQTAVRLASPKREDARVLVLDDLFRKTSTKPHLYWLPVSEQVAAANRAKRASLMS